MILTRLAALCNLSSDQMVSLSCCAKQVKEKKTPQTYEHLKYCWQFYQRYFPDDRCCGLFIIFFFILMKVRNI